MRTRKIRVFHVTTVQNAAGQSSRTATRDDKLLFEIPDADVDSLRARARKQVESRGLSVSGVSFCTDGAIHVFVTGASAPAMPLPGWQHRRPARPPRP